MQSLLYVFYTLQSNHALSIQNYTEKIRCSTNKGKEFIVECKHEYSAYIICTGLHFCLEMCLYFCRGFVMYVDTETGNTRLS